ncbi:MAG: DNA topoisomerase [Campylobacterales bacterium]|nr:DNA topoisomerase [Campylobacterales bacterium]
MANLMIVESPAKAKTIKKILEKTIPEKKWDVVASRGYIKNLPKEYGLNITTDGVDAKWVYEPGKKQFIEELKKKVGLYTEIYIATDDDTEGEKIAYDLVEALAVESVYKRVSFCSITERAIKEAIENPRSVSEKKYKLACSRRYVDRDEGYGISDVLRFDFKRNGLSFPQNLGVGRAISPALHLIADVERDIKQFEPEEYVRVKIRYLKDNHTFEFMSPTRYLINNRDDNIALSLFKRKINKGFHEVVTYISKLEEVLPPEPLHTATLQSAAFYTFGMSGKEVMTIAQELYENGAISYHRTDSNLLSDEIYVEIVEYLYDTQSPDDVYDEKRKYKARKNTENSHEAIRPARVCKDTEPGKIEKFLDKEYGFVMGEKHRKIYDLIWYRTIATQMTSAIYDRSTVKIEANGERFDIRANALVSTVKKEDENGNVTEQTIFQPSGWMKLKGTLLMKSITEEGEEFKNKEVILPTMSPLDEIRVLEISEFRTSTKAPYRYGEGRFIKTLEKLGIARPSTLDSIIPSLEKKELIHRINGVIFIKKLGLVVDEWVGKYCAWLNSIEGVRAFEEAMEQEENGESNIGILYEYHEKINKLKADMGYLEKNETDQLPSDAQILFAKQIAIKKGLIIKEECYLSAVSMSEFINANIEKSTESKTKVGNCPECGKGNVFENTKAFGCSRFKDGCKFTLWKESNISLLEKFGINADEEFLKEVVQAALGKKPIFSAQIFYKNKNGAYIDIHKGEKSWVLKIKE